MSDYQAIFDAVRSRFRGDFEGVFHRCLIDALGSFHHTSQVAAQEFGIAAAEMARPSVLFRPCLSLDGDEWCALYGDDLQEGVCAFGKSPEAAMLAFDKSWAKETA